MRNFKGIIICENIHPNSPYCVIFSMIHMPPKPIASAGCNTTIFLCQKLTFQIKIYIQTRVFCSISIKFSRGNIYGP